jgi:hypothetical protein
MSAIHATVRLLPVLAGALAAFAAGAAAQSDDLCGRPQQTAEALLESLSKAEKLPEIHRDKAYVVLNDQARDTIWTFTVAGHPAHPSAVCRHFIKDGDAGCGSRWASPAVRRRLNARSWSTPSRS